MSEQFSLAGHDYITLNNLLKVEGWCHSGALAKQVIDAGEVMVDGCVETRKRCKIRVGQSVSFNGQTLVVTK